MTMNTQTLTTQRLKLRRFTPNDIEPLHQILLDPVLLRYFPKSPHSLLRERCETMVMKQIQHWADYGYGRWALEPITEAKLIGWCGLQYLTDTDEIEVGYLLDKAYWGQGLITEAAQFSIQYGFETLDIKELIGITHPDNTASQRVLEKIGLQFTGPGHYFGMDCYRYVVSL
ncbi:MAG: GNAT family N-acetyltransferase [Gammaproteobacteria bacterium]|nr:GNAT family N-acetyltransferase [Gammaproteobacteria bacterium]